CSWIVARIGDCAFSDNGASLPEVVGRLLLSQKETIAVAESCTGGLVAHLLTSIPGSSGYFLFSGVTYSNNSKMNVLGVSEDTIFANGAVSQEVAREMALGTRKVAGSTYAVATTGIAGPCIGLAAPDGVESITLELSFGDRGMNKRVFAFCALDMLRRKLLQGRK
ncbi:MAG: damage-inducible protein CinA, partial [Desulfococcus sp. 4484_241]